MKIFAHAVKTVPLALLFLSASVFANPFLQRITQCDADFFNAIYDNQATFKKVTDVTTNNQKQAWIVSGNSDDERVVFSQPVKIDGLTLTGYLQSNSTYSNTEQYYFWGFSVAESAQEIVNTHSEIKWQSAGNDWLVMPLIKRSGDKTWQANNSAVGGIAPSDLTTEKLAMINDSANGTTIYCSIQGNVSISDLIAVRPDLVGVN